MALKQIKNKIISTKKTGKVTKAMESVSAVKMRKSQERAFQSRPYVHAALRILERLSGAPEARSHTLTEHRNEGRSLIIIVTSDKGLAGSVNSAVLKKATEFFTHHSDTDVVAIGRKALEFAKREKMHIISEYTNITDGVTLPDIYAIADTVIRTYTADKYQSVHIIYQNFISTFEQEPTERQILPLDPAEIHYILQGIHPQRGAMSSNVVEEVPEHINYSVEPSPEEVLNTLLPQLVEIVLYHALLESKASEHSARMVAMKNATDKSKEVARSLTLVYNKERQASITAEVAEITGGMEAMK